MYKLITIRQIKEGGVMRRIAVGSLYCSIFLILFVGGCELDSDRSSNVTNSEFTTSLMNYWSTGESTSEIRVHLPQDARGLFSVNVPEGGVYRLNYTSMTTSSSGDFYTDSHIVFQAYEDATLCIGLGDDGYLISANIEKGQLNDTPIHNDGNIGLFAWPFEWNGWPEGTSHPTDMFLSAVESSTILVDGGTVAANINTISNDSCRVVSPTPTPNPAPPAPTPTPGPWQCNTTVQQGGDTPETHTIEMGAASGTFDFYYETYSIRDQILVTYEGTVLYDTGCVGEDDTVSLTYSGTSTLITVQVIPNCAGTTGTLWDFRISCPY